MKIEDIKTILDSGDVQRYHAMVCVKNKQTNSQHQWRASMILGFIYNKPISYQMLMACMLHDFYEIFTGDIPSTVKWEHPEIKKIVDEIEDDLAIAHEMYVPTQEEKDAIKIADCLEMITFLAENVSIVNSVKARKIMVNHIESILNKEPYKFKNVFNSDNIYKIIGEYSAK
jgi:5'-deoxynucleotidase YfbR-like HD superfamily hydrolase